MQDKSRRKEEKKKGLCFERVCVYVEREKEKKKKTLQLSTVHFVLMAYQNYNQVKCRNTILK